MKQLLVAVLLTLYTSSAWAAGATACNGDAYCKTVMARRPVLYWRMDDASCTVGPSTVITDASCSSNHGRLDNGLTNPTCGVTSLVANTSDAAVTFAETGLPERQFGTLVTAYPTTQPGPFTVQAWVNLPSACPTGVCNPQVQTPFGTRGASFGWFFSFYNLSGTHSIGVNIGDSTNSAWCVVGATGSFNWSTSTTYDFVIVVTSTTWEIFVDGSSVDSDTFASCNSNLWDSLHSFVVAGPGNTINNDGFNGTIDEVAAFARALTSTEISNIHDCGASGTNCIGSTGNCRNWPYPIKYQRPRHPSPRFWAKLLNEPKILSWGFESPLHQICFRPS